MGSKSEGHDCETLIFSFFYFWLSFINQDGHGSYSLAVTKIAAWKEQEETGLNKTPSKKDHHNTHFFFRLRNFRVRIMHKTWVCKSLEN